LVLIFACLCGLFWFASMRLSVVSDDAFISFRYAKHLVEGKGLVFNEGERVEGYTNFLWTLLMAAGHMLGFQMPLLAQSISILCAALLVIAVGIFSRSCFRDRSLPYCSYIAPTLLAANPLFWEHMRSGLETVFFALLTFLSVATWCRRGKRGVSAYLTGFLLGLAYLTRPEAGLWAAGFIAVDTSWALIKKQKLSDLAPTVAKYVGVFASIVLVHIAWRVSYYGDWLPNTFYAKSVSNWAWGVNHTYSFLLATGFLPTIAAGVGPVVIRKKWAVGMSAIICTVIIYNLRMGGDFIFTGRFLIPLLPMTYIMIQELARSAFSTFGNKAHAGRLGKGLILLCPAGLLVFFLAGAVREWGVAQIWAYECRQSEAFNVWAGKCIRQHTDPTETIAVVSAGRIPYYAERRTIDMLGLNDRHIARYGIIDKSCYVGHQRTDIDYILDRRPEVILVPNKRQASRFAAAEYHMHQNPRFPDLYRRISFECEGLTFRIYVRRDLLSAEHAENAE